VTGRLAPALVAVLVLVAGCGGTAAGDGAASSRPDGRMVLVSGRDDHGQLVDEVVPVYAAAASADRVGGIVDGTLAHVTEIDGTWLHVVSAEGRPADGWVDDFHLRGTVHLVGPAPSCRVSLSGRLVEAGLQAVVAQVRSRSVLVSAVDGSARGWVDRGAVQELGPQGPSCGEDPPGSTHTH
jgi:hypothetical protein